MQQQRYHHPLPSAFNVQPAGAPVLSSGLGSSYPVAQQQQQPQGAPPQLDARFLASIQSLYPSVASSMAEVAAAIHAYLTGRANIVYEERQTSYLGQSSDALLQQRAIESLLVQTGQTPYVQQQQLTDYAGNAGYAPYLLTSGGYAQQQQQRQILPPTLAYGLYEDQAPNQPTTYHQALQIQQASQMGTSQPASPPGLHFSTGSQSSASTAESPLLSDIELAPQSFQFDASFGAADIFSSSDTGVPTPAFSLAGVVKHFEARSSPQSSRDGSPLTSSPASSFTPASPYHFNAVPGSTSFGSEAEFLAACNESEPKKKHACRICHRGFARAFNLKSHMLTHDPSRPKPHVCPHTSCARGFSRAHDLERHRQGIHNDGPLHEKSQMGLALGGKARKRSVRGVSSV